MAWEQPERQTGYNEGSGFGLSPVGHKPTEAATGKVAIGQSAGRRGDCRDGGKEVNQGSGSEIVGFP